MTVGDFVSVASQVAPIFSAIGLLLGAGAAWTTYYLFHRKTAADNWLDTFRKLYEKYWESSEMAEMRKYLASDAEYENIHILLKKRLSSSENKMTSEENDVLEKIDRFCALMIRILSFGERKMDASQRMLYDPLFRYWTDQMQKRESLMEYIRLYWKTLYARLKN